MTRRNLFGLSLTSLFSPLLALLPGRRERPVWDRTAGMAAYPAVNGRDGGFWALAVDIPEVEHKVFSINGELWVTSYGYLDEKLSEGSYAELFDALKFPRHAQAPTPDQAREWTQDLHSLALAVRERIST